VAIHYENGLWLGLFRDDFREEDLKVEEKQNPTECKYCGCSDIRSETDSAIHFKCFSSYWHDGSEWNIATNCAARCAVQLVELRERVQRAVDALKKAKRYTVTPGPRNTLDWDRNPDGSVTDSAAVDEALAILEGERE